MNFVKLALKTAVAIWVALLMCLLAGVAGGLVIRGCNAALALGR